MGGYLSAGGLLTRTPRPKALEVFRSMPRSRLLLETDAPDLPPADMDQSSPEYLPIIGQSLALDLEISLSALEQLSYANACALLTTISFNKTRTEGTIINTSTVPYARPKTMVVAIGIRN